MSRKHDGGELLGEGGEILTLLLTNLIFLCNFVNTSKSKMNPSIENTFGKRLRMARKMSGFSLQKLSDNLAGKVTKQALSKYETGAMNPSSEVLLEIAGVLNLRPEYFLQPETTKLEKIQFRKKARLAARHEDAIVEKVRNFVERFLEVERILGVDNVFENPLGSLPIKSMADIEKATMQLRIGWDLGSNPIHSIVDVLEQNGIKVYLKDEVEEFDGLAVYTSSGIPIVAVNRKGKSIERIRFTIIHELAHLLLQFSDEILNDEKNVETACHYFASNFLLPTDKLISSIGGRKRSYIRINELINIKESYGISIRATVHRLKKLNVITEDYYRRWMVYMSKTYGAKEEPGDYAAREEPSTFDRLVNRALAEEYISISKAASLWNTSIDNIRKGFGKHE